MSQCMSPRNLPWGYKVREFKSQNVTAFSEISKILTRKSFPKSLVKFDDNPLDWPNFIYQYKNSTKICGFSNEENQCVCKNVLKEKLWQWFSLLILLQNVNEIINLLETRFGRPEYIISMLLDKVKRFPPIIEQKLERLVEFYNEIMIFVVFLQCLEKKG